VGVTTVVNVVDGRASVPAVVRVDGWSDLASVAADVVEVALAWEASQSATTLGFSHVDSIVREL
jgi:hypothetical protein